MPGPEAEIEFCWNVLIARIVVAHPHGESEIGGAAIGGFVEDIKNAYSNPWGVVDNGADIVVGEVEAKAVRIGEAPLERRADFQVLQDAEGQRAPVEPISVPPGFRARFLEPETVAGGGPKKTISGSSGDGAEKAGGDNQSHRTHVTPGLHAGRACPGLLP